MDRNYFCWLCKHVGADKRKYHHVMNTLDHVKFRAFVPNDDNREEDGLQLRRQYLDELGDNDWAYADTIMEPECSVLEMMIALCYRLEFETAQSRWEKTPEEWFWILIDNLGLSDATDGPCNTLAVRNRVRSTILGLVNRTYEANGEGGLFPLKYPKHDQKTIEIWYQMTEYIMENYPI